LSTSKKPHRRFQLIVPWQGATIDARALGLTRELSQRIVDTAKSMALFASRADTRALLVSCMFASVSVRTCDEEGDGDDAVAT
jgi:hypothetical protein